jgi:hypothetical protein
MNSTIIDYVYKIKDEFFDRKLVSYQTFQNLREYTKILVPESKICFETLLGSDRIKSDFSVVYQEKDKRYKSWFGQGIEDQLTDITRAHPVWERITLFLNEYKTIPVFNDLQIKSLRFSFHDGQQFSSIHIPDFFCEIYNKKTIRSTQKSAYSIYRFFQYLQPQLNSDKFEETLTNCLRVLPGGSEIYELGVLYSYEENDRVRFGIRDLPLTQLSSFLKHINWPGNLEGMMYIKGFLSRRTDMVKVKIDVGDRVFPRIEIEFSNQYDKNLALDRWEDPLTFLVEKGLCTPYMLEAILQWDHCTLSQYTRKRLSYLRPESSIHSQIMDGIMGAPKSISPPNFARNLTAVKLIYHKDGLLEAKGCICLEMIVEDKKKAPF